MTLDEQRESFWRAIEAEPDKAQYKYEFSDWLEERGEEDLAYCMRWCAGWGKYPKAMMFTADLDLYHWVQGRMQQGHEYIDPMIVNEFHWAEKLSVGSERASTCYEELARALKNILSLIAIPAPKYAEVI